MTNKTKQYQYTSDHIIDSLKKSGANNFNFLTSNKCGSSPEGGFALQIRAGTKLLKTRSISIPKLGKPKDAFDLLVATAAEYGERLNIELAAPSLDLMLEKIGVSSSFQPSDKKIQNISLNNISDHPLMVLFGDLSRFKAAMKYVYNQKGFDRCQLVLSKMQEIVDELHEEKAAARKSAERATLEVAKALFKVHKETGFNMSEHAGNNAVRDLYRQLVREAGSKGKRVSNSKATEGNVYTLDGVKWDGQGIPPTNYIKWLKENDKENYEELRA